MNGRVAIVTGASRGIGCATAKSLAAAGAKVAVAARSEDEIRRVADDINRQGFEAMAIPCDVRNSRSVEHLCEQTARHFGKIDILVNNAGVATSAPLVKLKLADWEEVLAVNLTGVFLCTRAVMGGMMQRNWGRIINIASTAGLQGERYIAAYAASKHGVVGLTRCASAEGAAHGVTVNAVCPGFVDTAMTDASASRIAAATGKTLKDSRSVLAGTSAQRRLIQPEEVAEAVKFFCAESSMGITGQALVIDGGTVHQ